ncbi:MAG: fimbrial biogenesis outer membrane usher protein [Methylobacter sp.]|nr:fimbrial biogenesis outer membrane usher protein [Methylobacter sp.]
MKILGRLINMIVARSIGTEPQISTMFSTRGRLFFKVLTALTMIMANSAGAEPQKPAEVEFNSSFLRGGSAQQVDISRFQRGNPVLPGEYLVDLHVNGKLMGHFPVRFVAQPDSDIALPCIERTVIEHIGLDFEKLSELARAELLKVQAGGCADLSAMVKDAAVSFDLSLLRLDLSVPQAALLYTPRGYVSPELWDGGVSSATLSYNLNAFRTAAPLSTTSNGHLDLTGGLNFENWHLRQRSSMNVQSNGPSTYQNIATYLLHDLPSITSRLSLGDSFTDGAMFDSIGFRGVSLGTDDRMRPDSQRNYAPTVRGIARTNARVKISQNGNTILDTTVTPGAFEINDIYATGYGGDLLVTVYEADGSQQNFTVPYAYVVQLLRPGIWRYNTIVGEVRETQINSAEKFGQATLQYGFNSLVTGYAGSIVASSYMAGLVGAAFNTSLGAIAIDLTQAKADIRGVPATSGQSLRVSYSKLVSDTHTYFTLAAYRYSSNGYWSFHEALAARDLAAVGADPLTINHQRSQLQLNINQNLGERWGNVFLAGSTASYWNRSGTVTQFQAGYNNFFTLAGINPNYNISVARQLDGFTGNTDDQVLASVSLPLGSSTQAPRLTASFTQHTVGSISSQTEQEIVSGTAGENNELSYSALASQADGENVFGAGGGYRSPYTTLSASASKGSDFSQQSLGATGGVVLHPGGVTLANQMGDTIGIVEAPGAEGARVTNSIGTRIDGRGYAVLPFLSPYRMNTVSIDPDGVQPDVEFKTTSQQIAPRSDTVAMIRFATVSGRAVMVTAYLTDRSPIPFGASIFDAEGSEVGLAGQDGRIFLRGIADAGTLTAKWGDATDQQCGFEYQLPPKSEDEGPFLRIEAVCSIRDAASMQNNARLKVATLKPVTEGI